MKKFLFHVVISFCIIRRQFCRKKIAFIIDNKKKKFNVGQLTLMTKCKSNYEGYHSTEWSIRVTKTRIMFQLLTNKKSMITSLETDYVCSLDGFSNK